MLKPLLKLMTSAINLRMECRLFCYSDDCCMYKEVLYVVEYISNLNIRYDHGMVMQ